ncbi:hypothetical protein DAI21_18045 [Lelliottia sp. WB101]|uniref:hypothetical protein n=1 Tax=Lelliottia sp. WB101 TaxID=2153385 RepID=UPI000D22905F|nr:hypothetical protein [Lelliottia sp. WB101]AVY99416.1 hypothetical protein DAI21_18045 [Lelliottia sp. WB101]
MRQLINTHPNHWVYGDFTIRKVTRDNRVTTLDKYEVHEAESGGHCGSYFALAEAVNHIDKLYLSKETYSANTWLANRPLLMAANAVLCMYQMRQELSSESVPPHTPAEIEWACDQLFKLADVAAYAGSDETTVIRSAAEHWKKTGNKPGVFVE